MPNKAGKTKRKRKREDSTQAEGGLFSLPEVDPEEFGASASAKPWSLNLTQDRKSHYSTSVPFKTIPHSRESSTK